MCSAYKEFLSSPWSTIPPHLKDAGKTDQRMRILRKGVQLGHNGRKLGWGSQAAGNYGLCNVLQRDLVDPFGATVHEGRLHHMQLNGVPPNQT